MTELLQIELESSKIVALDALAAHAGKRRDELVAQAVEDLLALEKHNIDAIREGLADLEARRVVPHEKVLPTIEALRPRR
jgi:predicted transcriptional regulator